MIRPLLTTALLIAAATPALAVTPGTHWDYTGEAGAEHWAQLTPEFAACAGKNQSPIDLRGTLDAALAPLQIHYRAGGTEVGNNGHAFQVGYTPGSYLTLDGQRYELVQFHFHVPSENHIQGRAYPLEAHLVHADPQGQLAVLAVMFEEGAAHPLLEQLTPALPAAGQRAPLRPTLDARGLLPQTLDYYRFNGSLTTPPCTEGVRWLVLKQPVSASRAQIGGLRDALGHANARPLQPVNARVLVE